MDIERLNLLLWILFALVWLALSLRTKPTGERAPLVWRLRYGIPVVIGCCLLFVRSVPFASLYRLFPESRLLEGVSLFLVAAGIAFAVWARLYIGGNWSVDVSIKVGHELIRGGPYRWVRHPIYSGILLALVGTALGRRQAIGFIAAACFCLGFWIKSRLEEQFMQKTFGTRYLEYSRSTGALIPRLRS